VGLNQDDNEQHLVFFASLGNVRDALPLLSLRLEIKVSTNRASSIDPHLSPPITILNHSMTPVKHFYPLSTIKKVLFCRTNLIEKKCVDNH